MKLLNRSFHFKSLLFHLLIVTVSQGWEAKQSKIKWLPIETIPMELNQTLMEFWCNGINYTELCEGWPGWPDPRRCFGEVMQGEIATKRKIFHLYDYSAISIGGMLTDTTCKKNETIEITTDEEAMNDEIYVWIIVLASVAVLGLISVIVAMSYHLYNNRGPIEIGSTYKSANALEDSDAEKGVSVIQEIC